VTAAAQTVEPRGDHESVAVRPDAEPSHPDRLFPWSIRIAISCERLDHETYWSTQFTASFDVVHDNNGSMSTTLCKDLASDSSSDACDDVTSVTQLLADLRAGRREAFDRMLPLVYDQLRRIARRELAVRPSDTLSTTALVHELYLKFSRADRADWQNRAHFLGVAAVAMRHILVDRARRRSAEKRGGANRHVTLDDGLTVANDSAESLLEIHEALDHLATIDERLARVVECRFFGGMTEQETAEALSITERTVRRDWVKARGLLYQILADSDRSARTIAPQSLAS
jgi:RNA polymerase sigma factor (TIGR02999 family)